MMSSYQRASNRALRFEFQGFSNTLQMMYVSGETAEASPETTGMIEEIVRQQVIEMVSQAQTRTLIQATR